jgi:hypothetical protein
MRRSFTPFAFRVDGIVARSNAASSDDDYQKKERKQLHGADARESLPKDHNRISSTLAVDQKIL